MELPDGVILNNQTFYIKGDRSKMGSGGNGCNSINTTVLLSDEKASEVNEVTVRWHDGYKEKFTRVIEVRFGSDLLWIRYVDKADKIRNRHIPLRSVRWFGLADESHEETTTA